MVPLRVLNRPYWHSMLTKLYSQDKASLLLYELDNGVHIGRPAATKSIESNNWPSSLEFYDDVTKVIQEDVDLGRALGPLAEPPFDNYIVSPLGAFIKREGAKVRVIHDLSYPINDSVNASIDPEEFSLNYASIDDAVHMCTNFQEPPYFSKIDLHSAYKHVAVHPDDWHLLGLKWPDKTGKNYFYFYKVLNFGLRSAPALFDRFASCLMDFMWEEGASKYTVRYVDDFLTIASSYTACAKSVEVMLDTCSKAGFKVQPSKVTKPSKVVEFLGIIVDSEKRELRISHERISEINQLLAHWTNTTICTKRQLLKLVGKLAFAARVVRTGRAFIGRLIQLSKKVKHLHHRIRINKQARADIAWWTSCLASHNGVAMFESDFSHLEVVHYFTDASNLGYGGCRENQWFAMSYTGSQAELATKSINWRELHAACKALKTWAPQDKGKRLIIHVDNSSVVHILNKLYTPVAEMMELVRTWCTIMEECQLRITVVYISTHDNTTADALSRLKIDEAKSLMPSNPAQVWPEPILYHSIVI